MQKLVGWKDFRQISRGLFPRSCILSVVSKELFQRGCFKGFVSNRIVSKGVVFKGLFQVGCSLEVSWRLSPVSRVEVVPGDFL